MNKVFISGGAGVIGTALVTNLLKSGAEIFVGDLKPCKKEWLGKVKYREGDLNFMTFEELNDFKPDLFFHLAATFERSEETKSFFEENYHHNIALSHHLLKLSKDVKSIKKIIFASSYLIYDPKLYLADKPFDEEKLLSENSEINPRNICGSAKLFFESELKMTKNFEEFEFVAARIFRVYGRGSRDIISRFIRSLIKKETLSVYRPEGRFDYIFADDVAFGLLRLGLSDYNGIVNLGFGKSKSIHDVLKVLKQHFPNMKTEVASSDIPFEASVADMSHFKEITGWTPETTLEEGIKQLIAFERNIIG